MTLTIYKTTVCPTCRIVMARLASKGLPYEVINVEEDAEAYKRITTAGFKQAPVFGWKGKLTDLTGLPAIEAELVERKEKSCG